MLVVGAGLSDKLAKAQQSLVDEQAPVAEKLIGCAPIEAKDLYEWAEKALAHIETKATTYPPKLELALALGLLNDRSWFFPVSIPLNATKPRHRVLARFAKERLFVPLWSLNWDCLLENALERVGFDRLEDEKPSQKAPWITNYSTVVIQGDFPKAGEHNHKLFCILKPHGCVKALARAKDAADAGDVQTAKELSERWMITSSDLNGPKAGPVDINFFDKLRDQLHTSPLIILGWKVSEPYLQGILDDALKAVLAKGKIQELSIIDIEFNDEGHTALSGFYGLEKEGVFFDVSPKKGIDTDDLLLWLQAAFSLDHLLVAAAELDEIKEGLEARAKLIDVPRPLSFLIRWADAFLPAWARLCWRGGLLDGPDYRPEELALERPDEHIPLNLEKLLDRTELKAAANLLVQMPENGGHWDVQKFPGALWDETNLRLVLPLPIWKPINELASLKPWFRFQPMEIVQKLDVLPLHHDPSAAEPEQDQLDELRDRVTASLAIPAFGTRDRIGVATFAELGA